MFEKQNVNELCFSLTEYLQHFFVHWIQALLLVQGNARYARIRPCIHDIVANKFHHLRSTNNLFIILLLEILQLLQEKTI